MKRTTFLGLLVLLVLFASCFRIPRPPEGARGVLFYDGEAKQYFWIDPAALQQVPPSDNWDAPNPWKWELVDTMTIYNANTSKPLFFWSNGAFYKPNSQEKGSKPFGSKQ